MDCFHNFMKFDPTVGLQFLKNTIRHVKVTGLDGNIRIGLNRRALAYVA